MTHSLSRINLSVIYAVMKHTNLSYYMGLKTWLIFVKTRHLPHLIGLYLLTLVNHLVKVAVFPPLPEDEER